ncbi:MAG: pirin family protein [Steroidobacteraceae bacterium]
MSTVTFADPTPVQAFTPPPQPPRRIIHRTRGSSHGGPIVRLMSPGDLGTLVKPFVFLDLFQGDMRRMQNAMGLHPHSGLATVTVFTRGDVRFDDPEAGRGTLAYGGVEWMRAGGGVWHGKEITAGESATMQGFQLWVALPPELENARSDSQYIEARDMPRVGPAHVIVGKHAGAASPVRAQPGFNYLLVTLKAGESWTYTPPAGHRVAWLALSQGSLDAGSTISAGEMAVFENSEAQITLTARDAEAVFVLGSAVPHPHPLHLGYYSVHTSAIALAQGEERIAELGRKLAAAGDRRSKSGTVPVFR